MSGQWYNRRKELWVRNYTMDEIGFDIEICALLEATYQSALRINAKSKKYSKEQIKLMIMATHIDSLAKTFLYADEHKEPPLDMKRVSLGLLGTADWLNEGV